MNYNELNLWEYKKMKTLSYFAVGLLLLSSFAALSIGEEAAVDKKTIDIQFLEPIVLRSEGYVELNVEGANARLYHAGEPILPVHTTSLSFPFGTKIVDIECETGEVKSMVLSDKIAPAPKPVIQGMSANALEPEMDQTIYNSDTLFPSGWFNYYTGGGLDANNEHKTFFTLRVYPVRYSPAMDTIYYVENLNLKITYDEPDTDPFPENSAYDMVIIAPLMFSADLQELIDHKNSYGMNTILKTTEEIYSEFSGVDKPEQIKYFIKDAIESWNIKFVLLVGGLKSPLFGIPKDDQNQGTRDWHVPVRYTNHESMDDVYDPGFISDLYYADIYDGEGEFSSWDSNGDGVFAKWKENSPMGIDTLDFYPDVYVGRLPCRNSYELNIMVNKIINYEKEPADSSWYNKIVAIAGDSHDDSEGYIEGELICDKILETYMTNFTPTKLYASNKEVSSVYTPVTSNIMREISAGCGHLLFDGHANPYSWTTHWPGEFDSMIKPDGGIDIHHFPMLRNSDKLPVCVVGGCHTAQFNVSFLVALNDRDNSKHMWTYGFPALECFNWWLTRKVGGGAIASIGNTGLGIGWVGGESDLNGDGVAEPVCMEGLGGYQQILFYKSFVENGSDFLGEAWGGAHSQYLNAFPGMDAFVDSKTVEQWVIIGDPSLKIGGYP
jgi:hypothetical protein